MVAKDWAHADGVDFASWQAALTGSAPWELNLGAGSGVNGLVEGAAEGILYGGCLSILVASLGTPYEIETAGTILFLEDVAAKPFQIDRMLMQLKLAGKFKGVRGIVFGEMRDCYANCESGLHAGRSRFAYRGGVGSSSCLWSAVRTCDGRKYHAADRRAGGLTVRDGGVSLKILEAAVSHAGGKVSRAEKHEREQTHSSDRHLRHGDGVACRNAEAARISRDRFGRGGLSTDVRFSGRARNSGGSAV